MPDDNAAAPREQRQPAESKPAIAMVESPDPDDGDRRAARDPARHDGRLAAAAAGGEAGRDAEPQPAEAKPVETKPEPKPVQAAPPKPVKNAAKAKERRRIDAPTREKADARGQGVQPLDARRTMSASAAPTTTPTTAGSSPRTSRATSSIPPTRAAAATAARATRDVQPRAGAAA